MRTVGRHWPTEKADGDSVGMCSYCSAKYPLSELVREPGGTLRCPTEGNGMNAYELGKLQMAARLRRRPHPPISAWSNSALDPAGTTVKPVGAPPGAPSNYDPTKI
jgi:hypothetical protein